MDNSCDGVSGGTHIRTYCDCEVYFLSLTGCFNNMLGESLVAWQPPAVNMQAVLPWDRMTGRKCGTQSCVPANSDELTSGVNIMRSNRLETSSALEHKHSKMPIQNAHF